MSRTAARSGLAIGCIRSDAVKLSCRLFSQLRSLATPDYHRHAPIGQRLAVGLCRLPVTRLSFELLRPTFLKSIHDVARQVRSSHADNPCETDRPVTGAARETLRSVLGVPLITTRKGLPRSIPSDGRLRLCLKTTVAPGRRRTSSMPDGIGRVDLGDEER